MCSLCPLTAARRHRISVGASGASLQPLHVFLDVLLVPSGLGLGVGSVTCPILSRKDRHRGDERLWRDLVRLQAL